MLSNMYQLFILKISKFYSMSYFAAIVLCTEIFFPWRVCKDFYFLIYYTHCLDKAKNMIAT
jgi:hypothetical protein